MPGGLRDPTAPPHPPSSANQERGGAARIVEELVRDGHMVCLLKKSRAVLLIGLLASIAADAKVRGEELLRPVGP
jgi:hypothetical protein